MHISGRRFKDLVSEHKKTAISMIIGLIAGPIVGATLVDYIDVTPRRLAGLLENDEVSIVERVLNITESTKSKAQVLEFNKLRTQFKQPITLENLDLSNKTLTGVNLDSIIILNSNLSGTNLENSNLENVQISGDLSNMNLTSSFMALFKMLILSDIIANDLF
jgi:uncharacterized protein YjbI with pentapeptide repeats